MEGLSEYSRRGYWISKEIVENSILYLGMNPSYPHKQYEFRERIFFHTENEISKHNYFKVINSFHNKAQKYSGTVELMSHYDLLVLRETKQDLVKKFTKTENGKLYLKKI
ncbi:hypothetical protein [Flammeovirga aprica]|uniref:Uncharacterized protein n=1 Tax=Flammeovirga aprica JL-4 TaxID=694437 RepID=A0A7X9XDM0_9BACT|nr:hypothetical protein [Flammeovirga aprica]NME72794.1 hypothetical protein [Flammeovirga aprica JL-4]